MPKTPDLFAWADATARQSVAWADRFGVARVCSCNCFWLFHDPDALLSRFTIIPRKSRWPHAENT